MRITFLAAQTLLVGTGLAETPAAGSDLLPRDEHRWCLGEKINTGSMRKFNFRMRGINTDDVCRRTGTDEPWYVLNNCLWIGQCPPSGGGFNCGKDSAGYVHGGVNVPLSCPGNYVKMCIDEALGVEGNEDYVCNRSS